MKDKNLWNTNTISLYTPENFFSTIFPWQSDKYDIPF